MSTEFTEELRRSLDDFVRNTTDAEFYQALQDADYSFFSQVEEPECYVVRRDVRRVQTATSAQAEVIFTTNFDEIMRRMTVPTGIDGFVAADHQDLALAA